jgi:hypothetical protein
MIWWLANPSRGRAESVALADMCEQESWLSDLTWRVRDNLQLCADFDIRHENEVFRLTIEYPSSFPDTPPSVTPRDGRRISYHQYGAGGELCLEYRPDNWDPTFTGAMMVASAQRLIAGERPADGSAGEVISAHRSSVGRDLRGTSARFIFPQDCLQAFRSLPFEQPVPIEIWERRINDISIGYPISLGVEDQISWKSSSPKPSTATKREGFVFRTDRKVDDYRLMPRKFLDDAEDEFPELSKLTSAQELDIFLVLGNFDEWVVLNIFRLREETYSLPFVSVYRPADHERLPAGHEAMASCHVAIVGCGSVGSKIATILARSGVRNFTLVDEDIFFSENLVRNDLDANAIGRHKVDAVASRIKQVVSAGLVTCRRVSLGHQESAGTVESVIEAVGKCDLIVDATADASAFNLASAAARRNRKPMVWCEVFGGGIGGIIARARPDLDPVPTQGRSQIRAWCSKHGIPWEATVEAHYTAAVDDQIPLVADDADVTVIAAHAARMAIDIIVRTESMFPQSAYAIGMTSGWIFSAPFDTWPIELRMEGVWDTSEPEATEEDRLALFKDLFPHESAS